MPLLMREQGSATRLVYGSGDARRPARRPVRL